jgi:Tol biopolymer transport system component
MRNTALPTALIVAATALAGATLLAKAPRADAPPHLLFSSNRDGGPKLYSIDLDFNNTQAFHATEGSESLASWSPDGKKISFCSSRSGNHDIWVMDADGTNVKQLTTDENPDYVSTWSPDSKRIAFTTERAGNPEIFVMNADGTDQHNITNNAEFDGDPAWSPNGKILFASKRNNDGFRLYTMDPDGANVQPWAGKQSGVGPVFPGWSKDGKKVAFGDEDGASVEIYIANADGSERKKLTSIGGLNTFPAWSPDGKQIALYHYDNLGASGKVHIVTVADGSQRELGEGGSFLSGRPLWKP